uniref:Uncharacterized protein n=1 Tax=Romanomermis culicivorax TaxID=13658 RepID=A0A915JKC6_ROMCU
MHAHSPLLYYKGQRKLFFGLQLDQRLPLQGPSTITVAASSYKEINLRLPSFTKILYTLGWAGSTFLTTADADLEKFDSADPDPKKFGSTDPDPEGQIRTGFGSDTGFSRTVKVAGISSSPPASHFSNDLDFSKF